MKNLIPLILCAAFLVINPAYAEESKKPLKVGAVVSLSGPASVHGESIRDGLILAKEDLAAKGINVDLAFEDDGSNSAKTISAIQSLSARGYKLFIGMTWSFQAENAAPVLSRLGALGYAPACSSQIAGGSNSAMLFGTNPSTETTPIIADWFKSNGVKSAGMIYAASGWGTLHEQIFRDAAAQAGTKISAVESYNYGEEGSSIPSLVTKLRTSPPDAIFVTGSKEGSSILLKKLIEQGIKSKILGTDDIEDAVMAGLIPADMKGIDAFYIALPISDEFRSRFKQRFNKDPYVYADSAYDGLMVFERANRETDGSPQGMRNYLISNLDYSGYTGAIKFDRNGDVHRGTFKIMKLNGK